MFVIAGKEALAYNPNGDAKQGRGVMKFSIKYTDLEWWFWAVIGLAIGIGLVGLSWGYTIAFWVSVANLGFYMLKEQSLTSFPVQVRGVWLVFMLIAVLLSAWWFYVLLFLGMVMVVFFDRCGIARVLIQMPWNKDVELK